MSTILWKPFENTIAVLPWAPLRLLCLPGQSPKRSCLHKVSSLSQIFSDVQRLLYSGVFMFRCSGSLIFWCLDVQRLRCWECDHVVQCSKVHKFICSEVECSSARCSKVQMFKGLQKVQQISAVTANVKHLRTLSDDAKCPQEHLASILNKARTVVMSKDQYDWCKLDETSHLVILCKLGSTRKSGSQHFQDLMWQVVLWVTWYLGSGGWRGGCYQLLYEHPALALTHKLKLDSCHSWTLTVSELKLDL